ncbi:tetratricopeptide repeat protein 39C [Ciona intestinalis]
MANPGSIELPPDFEDHILAHEGIALMLNNGFKESEALFAKFKDSSPLMSAGSSFVCFMQGLMSFEDDKLEEAVTALKSTQKLCNNAEEDLLDVLKNKFRKKAPKKKPLSIESVLQRRIIVGDCYLYIALIYFIKQDLTGYIKGGWMLRKAWKVYERCHKQIVELLKQHKVELSTTADVGFVNGNGEAGDSIPPELPHSESTSSLSSNEDDIMKEELELPAASSFPSNGTDQKSTLLRLYGAVCFGYGAFNLCVSLIPQNLLRIVNMMGFSGDGVAGMRALQVACDSEDMKAPLAMLCLLWYHTVVRPFFSVDGDVADAGLPEAERLLEINQEKYPTSSLVLFFQGRVRRCKRDVNGALESLQSSYDQAQEQRELQLLCSYEIGWCCIMQLNWERALENIVRLKLESKWSVCYYAYLTALLEGVRGDLKKCQEMMIEVPKLMKRKNNQLEMFVVRKAKVFQKIPPTDEHLKLLIFEIIYLWKAFPNCEEENLKQMLKECENVANPCLKGLKHLILAALYKCLGNTTKAVEYFQSAAQLSESDLEDGHISPFAFYELSIIMLESKHSEQKGVQLLKECKENFSGYDFENRLQMRIHSTELRLKEKNRT